MLRLPCRLDGSERQAAIHRAKLRFPVIEFFAQEPMFLAVRFLSKGNGETMKKFLTLLIAAAAITSFAPTPSSAQGIGVQLPGVGVQIGEPDRPRYREYYRNRDRARFREREVRGGCRTVTIERDDGTVRRIRRCD
jgi:hypothetical protein